MDGDRNIWKVLKWAGIAALVAVPIVVLLKKRRNDDPPPPVTDEDDVFSAELSD